MAWGMRGMIGRKSRFGPRIATKKSRPVSGAAQLGCLGTPRKWRPGGEAPGRQNAYVSTTRVASTWIGREILK